MSALHDVSIHMTLFIYSFNSYSFNMTIVVTIATIWDLHLGDGKLAHQGSITVPITQMEKLRVRRNN